MADIAYQKQAEAVQKIKEFNNQAKSADYSFGVSRWGGFQSTLPQTTDSSLYQSMMVNTLPQLTHCEQSPGISATGFHNDVEIALGKEALLGGEITKDNGQIFLWKIVWDKIDNKGDFYYCLQNVYFEDKIWFKTNPKKDPTNTTSEEYRFISRKLTQSEIKGSLYFCSGKENFTDFNGDTSGLLCLNIETLIWIAIPTGKTAPYDISKKGQNIEEDLKNFADLSQLAEYSGKLKEFNPSIVLEYNNRLVITGSKENPTQVKVSEYMNYQNFVNNVIGYNPNGLTIEDNRKASTFTIAQSILSATVFSDSIYFGTSRRMWIYKSISSEKGIDLDQISLNEVDNIGTIANKSVKVYYGNMFFASTSLTTPQFATKELEYKTSLSGGSYAVPLAARKLSQFIDETLKKCDVSNSCMGIYKDYVFWSVSINGEKDEYGEAKNNCTLVYKRMGDYILWSVIDYIHANYFFEVNGGGLYYCSANDGNIYQIREDINYIDRKTNYVFDPQQPYTLNPTTYQSVIQTGITGIDLKKDNGFSQKNLKYLYMELGVAADTILDIQIFGIGNKCDNCCTQDIWSDTILINYDCLDPNTTDPTASDPNIVAPSPFAVDLNYYRGVRYRPLRIVFKEPVQYCQLYVKIIFNNSAGFFLKSIQGVYSQTQAFAEQYNICQDGDLESIGNLDQVIINKDNEFAQEIICKTCNL
jgi:hypothetical protein